jgi:hypothetical protein
MKSLVIKLAPLTGVTMAFIFYGCFSSDPVATKDPGTDGGPKVETTTNDVNKDIANLVNFDYQSKELFKVSTTPYIGMVPTVQPGMPGYYTPRPCTEAIWMRQDDEDGSNRNNFYFDGQNFSGHNYSAGGFQHVSSPSRAGGNSKIHYCVEQVSTLPILNFDYAVILASNSCPTNGIKFTRRQDNEDWSNHNSSSGDVTPNIVNGGYTYINYCFVPGSVGAPNYNALFEDRFVYAKSSNWRNTGSFYSDDEDDGNNNGWSSTNTSYNARMSALVSAGSNTQIYFASNSPVVTEDLGTKAECRWTGGAIGTECTVNSAGVQYCKPIGEGYDWWNAIGYGICLW